MSDKNSEENMFTFAQLNFWTGRLYYPICNFLERVQPDIFSAQEVLCGEGSSSPDHMTGEMLMDKDHQYFDDMAIGGGYKGFTNTYGQKRQQHCATLTRQPFKMISKTHHPIHIKNNQDHLGRKIETDYWNLVHTVVELKNKATVNIFNCHGFLIIDEKNTMGGEQTDHIFQQVADHISKTTGPAILSGDFNLLRKSSPFNFLEKIGLKNLNDIYDISEGRNEFSWKANEIVSHIFINEDIIVDDYYVADDNASDHKALVMRASVKK